jgi:hypothetical protein
MCPSHFHQRRHFVMVKRYCTNCSSSLRASSLLILPVTNAQRIIAPAANTRGSSSSATASVARRGPRRLRVCGLRLRGADGYRLVPTDASALVPAVGFQHGAHPRPVHQWRGVDLAARRDVMVCDDLADGILAGERGNEPLDRAKLVLGVGHPAPVTVDRGAGPRDAELGAVAFAEPSRGLFGRAGELARINDLDADGKGVASCAPAPTRLPGVPRDAIEFHELCDAAVAFDHEVAEALAFGLQSQATEPPLANRPAVSCSTMSVGSRRPPWFGVRTKGAAFPAIVSRPLTMSNMPTGRYSRHADCQRNF